MRKVLIIEDEHITAKIIEKKLKCLNMKTILAHDGYAAVNAAQKERPDLIILDMVLPGGGGMSVLNRLKISTHTRDIPIIALTSIKDEEFKKIALEKGIAIYLEKPYDPETLVKAMDEVFFEQDRENLTDLRELVEIA